MNAHTGHNCSHTHTHNPAHQAYIGETDALFFGAPGPIMTTLALLVWLLTVAKDINATWLATAAILRKRGRGHGGGQGREGRTVAVIIEKEGGPCVEHVSDARCACCCLVSLIRLAVCVVLGWYGSLFLVRYSITLGDLLLNAVALEFVMTIDGERLHSSSNEPFCLMTCHLSSAL